MFFSVASFPTTEMGSCCQMSAYLFRSDRYAPASTSELIIRAQSIGRAAGVSTVLHSGALQA